MSTLVFWLVAAAGVSLLTSGCSALNSNEEYRQDKGRTVYRSADHTPSDTDLTSSAKPGKVPGE